MEHYRCSGHCKWPQRIGTFLFGAGIAGFLLYAGIYFFQRGEIASVITAAFLGVTVGLPALNIALSALTSWPSLDIDDQGLRVAGFVWDKQANWPMELSWDSFTSAEMNEKTGALELAKGTDPRRVVATIPYLSDFSDKDRIVASVQSHIGRAAAPPAL